MSKKKLSSKQKTAQEFTNVLDISNGCLYTRNGYVFKYIRILPLATGLLSYREKNSLIRQLSSEVSVEKEPFHFLAISRPADVQPLLEQDMQLKESATNPYQRALLQKEIEYLTEIVFENEVSERHFYFYLLQKINENAEQELKKRIVDFKEHFEAAGIKVEILSDNEIIQLCNLVNNPSTIYAEDESFKPAIPIFKGEK